MPTPELMTWVPSQRRWTKMYRGRRYYVSARQLGSAETKEASLHLANQWWRDKQAELDYAGRARRTPAPMEDLAAASFGLPAAFDTDGVTLLKAFLGPPRTPPGGGEIVDIPIPEPPHQEDTNLMQPDGTFNVAEFVRREAVIALLRKLLFGGAVMPQDVAALLPPARVQQVEAAVQGLRGESAVSSTERTVEGQVAAWLKTQQALVTAGALNPVRFANVRTCVQHFAAFVGEQSGLSAIDAERLDGFYHFCLSKIADKRAGEPSGWSVVHAKEVFAITRSFLRWLVERGTIPAPTNLASRGFRFGSTVKRVEILTSEEAQHLVSAATGKLKVVLLLMLNCGFTQRDVSDLRNDEMDWKAGRIIRKRSKTKDRDSTPEVNYPLWPETFRLLKEYRAKGERVLLTATGKPFVRQEIVSGRLKSSDIIAANYKLLQKKIAFPKSMKLLRKTGATLLDKYDPSGRIATLYLGHSPRSMKDRHYSQPDQEHFDTAVRWLGEQLGFVPG